MPLKPVLPLAAVMTFDALLRIMAVEELWLLELGWPLGPLAQTWQGTTVPALAKVTSVTRIIFAKTFMTSCSLSEINGFEARIHCGRIPFKSENRGALLHVFGTSLALIIRRTACGCA